MQLTIGKAISEIKSLLKINTDSRTISNRFIWSKICSNRSLIYSRELDKGHLYNSDAWQTIYIMPMELSDLSEACNIEFGYPVSKSKFKIPSTINRSTGSQCIKIYSLDNSSIIDIVDLDKLINSRTQKYKSPIPDAILSNDYLIIDSNVKGVKIKLIPDFPEEVELLNTCNEYDSCGNIIQKTCPIPIPDMDFNIQQDIWEAVRDKSAKDIATFYGISFEDKQNNARNDSSSNNSIKNNTG